MQRDKKTACREAGGDNIEQPSGGGPLDPRDVCGVESLRAALNLKLDYLSFRKAFETVHLDRGKMHEDVFAAFLLNEAIALGVIEPLNLPSGHASCLLRGEPIRHKRGAGQTWMVCDTYIECAVPPVKRRPYTTTGYHNILTKTARTRHKHDVDWTLSRYVISRTVASANQNPMCCRFKFCLG